MTTLRELIAAGKIDPDAPTLGKPITTNDGYTVIGPCRLFLCSRTELVATDLACIDALDGINDPTAYTARFADEKKAKAFLADWRERHRIAELQRKARKVATRGEMEPQHTEESPD